jgi:RNA polymerase sigma-70 factor (ECF subfamily)
MWPGEADTRELLELVRGGDGEAVNRLLARHREAVRRLVSLRMDRRLAKRLDASDVVQDALVDANRRLADYLDGPPIPFHLWLRRIALDRLIDAHRRHREAGKRSLDREAPLYDDRSSRELLARLFDEGPTPGAAAVRAEMVRRFEEALEELAEGDREILLLRHYEHLSNADAARVLGITEPAASMRHVRALRRLRDAVEEAEG